APALVGGLELDPVSQRQVLQEAELRVAMPAEDRVAGPAGRCAARDVARTERQRPATRVGEHDEVDAAVRQREAGDGPRVGPRPGLDRDPAGLACGPGAVEQALSEPSLDVDAAAGSAKADRPREQAEAQELGG